MYLNVYKNNPTENGTDGTALSSDGKFTSPLSVELNANQSENKILKLAIRTETGFKTTGETKNFQGENWTAHGNAKIENKNAFYKNALQLGGVRKARQRNCPHKMF